MEYFRKVKLVDKVWGTEEWLVNTEDYCSKILRVHHAYRCSLHFHKKKDETFYLAHGRILFEHGFPGDCRNVEVFETGSLIRVLPGEMHRFSGLWPTVLYEFSTHHEDEDSYRIEGELSGPVPKEVMDEYA